MSQESKTARIAELREFLTSTREVIRSLEQQIETLQKLVDFAEPQLVDLLYYSPEQVNEAKEIRADVETVTLLPPAAFNPSVNCTVKVQGVEFTWDGVNLISTEKSDPYQTYTREQYAQALLAGKCVAEGSCQGTGYVETWKSFSACEDGCCGSDDYHNTDECENCNPEWVDWGFTNLGEFYWEE